MILREFPAYSKLTCCGTCSRWYGRNAKVYCPIQDGYIIGTLTASGCDMWHRETTETFAIVLYAEIEKNLRTGGNNAA